MDKAGTAETYDAFLGLLPENQPRFVVDELVSREHFFEPAG